jgi:hypothetical protein
VNTHPIARVFAPAVFLSLVLLSLAFSFGSAQAQGPASPIAAPRIDRFDLDPPNRLVPGEALIFRLSGSPRGSASVMIEGASGKIALNEVMTGIYEGAYTIRNGDRIDADSVVTGNLRLGDRERSTVLGQALVENSPVAASQPVPTRRTSR